MTFYDAYCDFLRKYVALHSRCYPDHRTVRTEKPDEYAMIPDPATLIFAVYFHARGDFFTR